MRIAFWVNLEELGVELSLWESYDLHMKRYYGLVLYFCKKEEYSDRWARFASILQKLYDRERKLGNSLLIREMWKLKLLPHLGTSYLIQKRPHRILEYFSSVRGLGTLNACTARSLHSSESGVEFKRLRFLHGTKSISLFVYLSNCGRTASSWLWLWEACGHTWHIELASSPAHWPLACKSCIK